MLRSQAATVRFCTLVFAVLSVATGAQSKQPPAPSDDGQRETLAAQPRGGLSPDGRWLEREQELTRASKKGS
jgi:hypothetical protein